MTTNNLPQWIDPKKFAERRQDLQGTLGLQDMPRLKEIVALEQGQVEFNLTGLVDIEGIAYLQGKLQAEIWLICQRCLQPYMQKILADFMLSPVTNDKEAAMLRAPYEPLLVENSMVELATVIEDELLLNLPVVAKHAIEECLVAPAVSSSKEAELNPTGNPMGNPSGNPFKVLAGLKTNKR